MICVRCGTTEFEIYILYSHIINIRLILYIAYFIIHEDDRKRPKHVVCKAIFNKISCVDGRIAHLNCISMQQDASI